MGLYENVKETAKKKGYSISQLEKELGFPRSYINKFKTIQPSTEKIQRIADFLGVSLDYLVNGKEPDDAPAYYLNDETVKIAQEIFENRDLHILFDATRDIPPEDIQFVVKMVMALKDKGSDSDDTGC